MSDSYQEDLPQGWQLVELRSVVYVVNGTTPQSSTSDYWGGDIVWITPTDLGKLKEREIVTSERKITQSGFDSCGLRLVPSGTVILSSRAPIGHLGIAKTELCINQGCKALIPNADIDSDFLYFAMKKSVSALQALGSGSTFAEVSKTQVEKFELPLPPLTEQKRIAAILTEQLTSVEKARKASKARLESARALSEAYLREVFESEESRRWQEVTLGEIALEVQNGIYKSSEFYGEGKPFLRMYNVENTSWHINQNNLAKVIIDANEQTKFELRKGDLLISRVNSHELVRKCAWVTTEEESYVFENMLIRVRLSSDVDSKFVAQQLSTKALKEQIQGKAKRAIGQSSINATDIKQIKIRLPSLKTQSILASQLENDVSHSHQLHKLLKEEYGTVVAMPMALLKQAFSGTF